MIADVSDGYRHRLVVPDFPSPAEYVQLLEECHAKGVYSNFGPVARRLEARMLAAFGAHDESCVTSSNATAGLSASLLATCRTGQVLLPAFTFPASLGAIRAAGMSPIVADVDPNSWTLTGNKLERALARTGATVVMLLAPFGIARDWRGDLAICRKRGVAVVIDNASGLGGQRRSESIGENVFEVFSMHATKPFAVGEGGAIFAHRDHDAALRSALNFALNRQASPGGPIWGFNGKMSELHAAVGIAQMDRIHDLVHRRRIFAAIYQKHLAKYPEIAFPRDVNSAPWQFFPVLLPSAEAAERFIEAAALAGAEIRRYYRPSLSQWPETQRCEECPVAEDLAERLCVLPVRAASAETEPIAHLVLESLDRALAGL